jgi:hypothetical protein
MFDYFKQKKDDRPLDVKSIRHRLLQFIKEQLQRWEGGEGSQIKSLQLFLAPLPEEIQLYESVVYFDR